MVLKLLIVTVYCNSFVSQLFSYTLHGSDTRIEFIGICVRVQRGAVALPKMGQQTIAFYP
jgi:hypothetical protein